MTFTLLSPRLRFGISREALQTMKTKASAFPVLVLLIGFAQPSPADDLLNLFTHRSEDKEYAYSITRARALSVTRWADPISEPPLSVSRAVALAKEEVKRKHGKFDDFEVTAIDLRRVHYPPQLSDIWYYSVAFFPIIDGHRIYEGNYAAVVLMDGSVVEPIVTKLEPQ